MAKCFRCGSKLYMDTKGGARILRCTLCTATNDETGHMAIEHLGLLKILKIRCNSFWVYYWRHANLSYKWWHSAREVLIHIDLVDDRYHVEIFDRETQLSVFLSESWKTLKTAKKWALVRGLDRKWVENTLREKYGDKLD